MLHPVLAAYDWISITKNYILEKRKKIFVSMDWSVRLRLEGQKIESDFYSWGKYYSPEYISEFSTRL